MAHDVFISYSSKDKPAADAVCAMLERDGVRCWIAPRDVLPGDDWAGSIIDAIAAAKVFVLAFSGAANASSQVKREVERAANHEVPIIPFRIENVQPDRTLEYFISTPHWLDAYSPPLDDHIRRLAGVVEQLVARRSAPTPAVPPLAPEPTPAPTPMSAPAPGPAYVDPGPPNAATRRFPVWGWLAASAVVAVVVVGFVLANHGAPQAPAAISGQAVSSAAESAPTQTLAASATPAADPTASERAALVGRWAPPNDSCANAWSLNFDNGLLNFGANTANLSGETIDAVSTPGELDTKTTPPGPTTEWAYVLNDKGDVLSVTNRASGETTSYTRCAA